MDMGSPLRVAGLILLGAGLCLPAKAGKIYWVDLYCHDFCDSRIFRANQDGSDVSAVTGILPSTILGLGLDPADEVGVASIPNCSHTAVPALGMRGAIALALLLLAASLYWLRRQRVPPA